MPDLKDCQCGKKAEFVKEANGYGRVVCTGNRPFLKPGERCYMKTTAAPGNRSIESWNNRAKGVAAHSTSDNNERDVICSDSMCDYCAKVETCNGFEDAGDCFVGRKLTPIS